MASPLAPDDPASLGGYRLSGRLGEGGQGVVYLAHSPEGEPVAIKLLSAGDRTTRARLARELEALESIASFCTARVLAVSADGPRPFVVSEYVDGPSLADRVRERGPLRGGDLERLAVGTATALAAIHAAGIVHRDFKPANVLLGPDGPRVVDFGIARAEGAATLTSGLIGTPAYLAPEQISGSPAAPASDVFAWASSMLYAATGASPFGADTVPAVLHRVLHAEPDLTALPPRLRGLIASCLAKEPSRRPTAQQLMVSLVNPHVPGPAGSHGPGAPPSPGSPSSGDGPPTGPPPGAAYGSGPRQGAAYETAPPPGTAHQTGPRPGAAYQTGPHPPSAHQTGPGSRVADTHETGRGRSRGLLIGVSAAVAVVLAGAVATTLYPNRTPTTPSGDDDRSTSASSSASSPPSASATASSSAPPSASPSESPSASPSGSPSESPSASASASPSASGTPTTGTGGDLKIPASFAGTWTGHTTSTNPMDADGAENTVVLKPGSSTAAWSEKNPPESCSGTITLTKVEEKRLTFSLGANKGGCIAGTIWLAKKGDTLTYTWRDVPGYDLVTQTGDLHKSQP
ncbi:serine/threonine-protein kinase [Nonomuraea sp. NPDC050786]|uniref:serine/threonine-protein kinase n=1 Tax=Nonomuraea sp. NPDC050786 TaxID=3154840 RepID=UPI0033C5F292